MAKNRICVYLTVFVAVAAWAIATFLGWTRQEHEVLLRTGGRGEELSPDFRGIPTAPEGSAKYVRSKVSNLWLHRQIWEPEGGKEKVKAVVAFAHGYAEYSGRFLVVPEALKQKGIAVTMQDFEGHGRSEGDRVFTPSFSRLVEDYANLVRDMRATYPGVPVVCAGQSMGSLVASLAAESDAGKSEKLCDALVVMGLATQGPMERTVRKMPFVLTAVQILSAILPHMPLTRLNTLDELSTDVEEYTSWGKDPYCTTVPIRTRMGTQMLLGQLAAADNARNITVPLLVIHGSDDTIALPDGPHKLYEGASTAAENKKLVMYDGSHHCVLMEPKYREKALDEFSNFVLTKVVKSPEP